MMETLRRFGLGYCDVETMLWNVSVMLRALTLNIDGRNKKPISIIFYLFAASITLSYFYVYLVSMSWFVFKRCQETGDLLSAIIVFSLGVSSEIGTVKMVYMFLHIGQVREIVAECLACDATVVAGSRFSSNLLTILRQVKKRALVFWVVLIVNGLVYVVKPIVLPGRHFTEDFFVLYVESIVKKWRNVRDYYMKEKKRSASSMPPGVKQKKKYNYYDYLSFLDVNLKDKRKNKDSEETIDLSKEQMNQEYLTEAEIQIDNMSYEQYPNEDDDESKDSSSTAPSFMIKQEKEEASTSQPTLSFETHIISPSDRVQDDHVKANKNFLLSLLPDVTSLNERQNMRFRLGVLNLLNDIKFEP